MNKHSHRMNEKKTIKKINFSDRKGTLLFEFLEFDHLPRHKVFPYQCFLSPANFNPNFFLLVRNLKIVRNVVV